MTFIFRSPLSLPADHETPLAATLRQLANDRDRTAIIDSDTQQRLTRGALDDQSAALARALVRRDIGRGDIVAMALPNSVSWPVVALGIWRAGAAFAPLSTAWTCEEISRALGLVHPRAVIASAGCADTVRNALGHADCHAPFFVCDDRAGGIAATGLFDPGAPPVPPATLFDLAVVPFSSGSSGLPKAIRASHRNLAAATAQVELSYAFDRAFDSGHVTLAAAPFFHALGMCTSLWAPLSVGALIVSVSNATVPELLRLIEQHRVTHAVVPLSLLRELAETPGIERYDTRALRLIASGGDRLPDGIEQRVSERLGCVARSGYGMTEATCMIAAPLGAANEAGTAGWLAPGTEARLLDPADGQDVESGGCGELWIRGPQVASGYLEDPAATADAFTEDGWLRTGDLVSFRSDGQLVVVDRIKDLIKVGGASVAPAELELVLREHPCVADAAVVGRPHPTRGEVPIAYVVASAPVEAETLIAYAAGRTAEAKRLYAVHLVRELPRTRAGKLARRILRERERLAAA